MRSLMFATLTGIALLGSGIVMANIADGGTTSKADILYGEVTKFYSSDTLLLDNHRAIIRLAGTPGPAKNFAEEVERIDRLNDMVGGSKVRCTTISVDSYGLDLAQCWNHRGESLNQALLNFSS